MSVPSRTGHPRRLRGVEAALVFVSVVELAALVVGVVRVYPRHGLVVVLAYLGAVTGLVVITLIVVAGLYWLLRWIGRSVRNMMRRRTKQPVGKKPKTIHGTVVAVHPDHGSINLVNSSATIQLPKRTVVVYGTKAAHLQEGAGVLVEYDPANGTAALRTDTRSIGEILIIPFGIIYVLATVFGCILLMMLTLSYLITSLLRVILDALS